ncbi:sugar phosphate nucleotidyltransferase [Rugosimonospora africana]|uniref:Nucleotidyltransferase n=1 Tax=Rugosimonospora africana TaxID=556532 RepID=A0A8J3QN64_9ACTN|nr:sugar phosphate nucleotidyltransferase [Rugosimonospora africana]GIH14130.1 nucleotidyltransferase [Rugosimonospora africana]
MQCVILAGGIGSRMWPETRTVPKTLLPVRGRPFAQWQLEWLSGAGIDSVVYSVGYLGQDVREFVGDGSRWGLSAAYVDEGEQLRGTAGALRLAYDEGVLAEDFLVLYGDSWLQVDPAWVLAQARLRPEPALMTVYSNEGQWDTSNVIFEGGRVVRYAKGLAERPAAMRWIDYGLMAFRRDVIVERVAPGTVHDLAPVLTDLADEGLLAGAEVFERFYEIGSVQGREDLESFLRDGGAEMPKPAMPQPAISQPAMPGPAMAEATMTETAMTEASR